MKAFRFLSCAALATIHLAPASAAWSVVPQGDDERLAKRVEQLSALVKHLEELSKKHDTLNAPEAAHFLASCAIGFGSKNQKVAGIKGGREVDLFVGKLRGGEPLADPNAIDTALRGVATESKRLLDTLIPQLKNGELSEQAKRLIHMLVPMHEIARGAEEYIQATQRFNELCRCSLPPMERTPLDSRSILARCPISAHFCAVLVPSGEPNWAFLSLIGPETKTA